MKCLITGAGGFIGSHLAEYLLAQNQSVVAVTHRRNDFLTLLRQKALWLTTGRNGVLGFAGFRKDAPRLPALPVGSAETRAAGCFTSLQDNLEIECGDLLDGSFVAGLLERHEPDVIFHLAAQSLPLSSWQEPAQTFRINLIGSLKLFEAAWRQRAAPLIIAASSSSVYESGRGESYLNEESSIQPNSIYAISKIAMEQLAKVFCDARGLKLICVRPFFIIGPRKEGDVCSDFARGIARIERGEVNELPVGNLTSVRDFLDVRDAVSALWQIASQGKTGVVYNICSGRGYSIGDLLAMFKNNARVAVRIVSDPAKTRPIDDPIIIGNPARLTELGWKQRIDMDSSVSAILNYWRGVS